MINVGKLTLRVYLSWQQKRTGVCSMVFNDSKYHMLLWDFDEKDIEKIEDELLATMIVFHLPTIYIISSSPNHYHAYCFARRLLCETIHILSGVSSIDLAYLRLGATRGYFTLRISPRQDAAFFRVAEIKSKYPDEISPYDVTVNEYLTSNKGGKTNAQQSAKILFTICIDTGRYNFVPYSQLGLNSPRPPQFYHY